MPKRFTELDVISWSDVDSLLLPSLVQTLKGPHENVFSQSRELILNSWGQPALMQHVRCWMRPSEHHCGSAHLPEPSVLWLRVGQVFPLHPNLC